MAGYTPGKWEVNQCVTWADMDHLPCVVDEFGLLIAQLIDDGHSQEETEANAHLTAAAPSMLEALEAMVECFIKRGPFDEPLGSSEQAPSINAARAAISRARGEEPQS